MLFHPQIVTLTGLLANAEWIRRAMESGHVGWLAREVTQRDILVGYWPKENDPLIQWVEAHLMHHRFAAAHGYKFYDVLFPEETVRRPRSPRGRARP